MAAQQLQLSRAGGVSGVQVTPARAQTKVAKAEHAEKVMERPDSHDLYSDVAVRNTMRTMRKVVHPLHAQHAFFFSSGGALILCALSDFKMGTSSISASAVL